MPIAWQSPVEIDPLIASALAIYLYDIKGQYDYSERTIRQPSIKLEYKDIEEYTFIV